MADFYPVLSRAIAGLQDKSPETRRSVYDKAKAVLVAQLRGVSPPVAETEIARQRLALDEVIARIEREYAHIDAPEPTEPVASLEPAWAPPPPRPAPPVPEPAPQRPAERVETQPGEPADDRPEPAVNAGSAAPVPPPADIPVVDRPRVEIAAARAKPQPPWRKLAVGGGVAAMIGCVALAAVYLNRDAPSPLQPQPGQQPPAQSAAGPKISERVGADAGAPAAQPQPAAPAGAQAPGRGGEIAVAQRAVLYIEPTDGSQAPRALNGRVSWRVEAQNPGRGQPLETIVRADVEIPEAGLSLAFTIRRNFDAAFPASHIVGLRFQRTSDDGNGAVREAGVPQFKSEENERGAPLSAITSVLGENLFVSALSRVPVEVERNLELMRTRNWIDIPIRFTSGRRGIVAFEKGVSGDQRIAEGIRAWQ
jgi:hypothetical protein